jgi:hypothetical protein
MHRACRLVTLASVLLVSISGAVTAASSLKRVFATPTDAAEALVAAASAADEGQTLADVLGADDTDWIFTGDPAEDRAARDRFIAAYRENHAIAFTGAAQATLLVGDDGFPVPFPMVRSAGGGWSFAPALGKEEVLNRRIGRNELEAIQVLLAVVDAQREYAAIARDSSGLRHYARRLNSSPGKRDGLYWFAKEGEPESPLGPLVAEAARETGSPGGREKVDESPSYKGYVYRLLTRQGKSAPGGAYDYLVGDRLLGGFAVIAAPLRYGVTGISAFIVNHDGIVHEADLGPGTDYRFGTMQAYDPDQRWRRVDDAHTELDR